MPDNARLPELARSLRSFGNAGNSCTQEAHDAIFAPLLEARTVAAKSSLEAAVDVMNGHAILHRIEAAVSATATRGVVNAPRARSLSARALEATESLRRSLLALDELAVMAGTDDGLDQWVDQLRRVFSAADDACQSVAAVLIERDVQEPPPRWYARTTT